MQKFIFIFLFLASASAIAQKKTVSEITPEEPFDNILVKKIDSDKNSTSFIIWVKSDVRAHKHEHHTETLYVLEGEGNMKLGDTEFVVKAGDYVSIPENTVHSVEVTSTTPLKVISLQAPEFLGKDRVFLE